MACVGEGSVMEQQVKLPPREMDAPGVPVAAAPPATRPRATLRSCRLLPCPGLALAAIWRVNWQVISVTLVILLPQTSQS